MTTPEPTQTLRMDDITIGPSGQTFGQLKDAVRVSRATYTGCPCEPHLDAWTSAQDMLRAAYTRVGLPYVAP